MDLPVFGKSATTSFNLFATQHLAGAGTYSTWLGGGAPGGTLAGGVQAEGFNLLGAAASAGAGDFSYTTLAPAGASGAGSIALVGANLRLDSSHGSWSLFAGRAKRDLLIPERSASRPQLAGIEHVHRLGASRTWVGGGFLVVEDALDGDPARDGSRAMVVSGRIAREFSPWTNGFAEGYVSAAGGVGERAGIEHRMQRGQVRASLYSFSDEFPLVGALARPGERGLELGMDYRLSEWVRADASITLAQDRAFRHQLELRGSAGLTCLFGSNRPTLSLHYSRAQTTEDLVLGSRLEFVADRFSVELARASIDGVTSLAVEQVMNTEGVEPERTQARFFLERAVAPSARLEGEMIVQHEAGAGSGLAGESSLERSIGGRNYGRLGVGTIVRTAAQKTSASAYVLAGYTRRLSRDGWEARAEWRVPFSVTSASGAFSGRRLSVEVGHRQHWSAAAAATERSGMPGPAAGEAGAIEGVVRRAGSGAAGYTVLVDGQPRATTARDGSFRVRGLRAGTRRVALDSRQLDPGEAVAGGASRALEVEARGIARAEFEIAGASLLSGSLVTCTPAGKKPLGGARLTLRREGFSRTVSTSSMGAFQIADVPPDVYSLEIESEPSRTVDLRKDILGLVIATGCAAAPAR